MSEYTWPEIVLEVIVLLFCLSFVLTVIQWGLSFLWVIFFGTLAIIAHIVGAIFRGIRSLFSSRKRELDED